MTTARRRGYRRALRGAWRAGVHRAVVELPLLVWLVLVWGALWRDWSAANLIFGLVIAVVLVRSFRLPPVRLSGRLHLGWGVLFLLWFAWQVVLGSFQVLWVALTQGRKVHNAVIRVPLRSRDDLILTAVGHVTSLIPGSLVVEVDRRNSVLFLHVLNVTSREQARAFRVGVLRTEAQLVRIMGSAEDIERVQADDDHASQQSVADAYEEYEAFALARAERGTERWHAEHDQLVDEWPGSRLQGTEPRRPRAAKRAAHPKGSAKAQGKGKAQGEEPGRGAGQRPGRTPDQERGDR
jgi:multicomponent Na+:H+ antiporter subunit E